MSRRTTRGSTAAAAAKLAADAAYKDPTAVAAREAVATAVANAKAEKAKKVAVVAGLLEKQAHDNKSPEEKEKEDKEMLAAVGAVFSATTMNSTTKAWQ